MIGELLTALGVTLLALSIIARHTDMPDNLVGVTGWAGSLLVIIGIGKMLFLDD